MFLFMQHGIHSNGLQFACLLEQSVSPGKHSPMLKNTQSLSTARYSFIKNKYWNFVECKK